MWREPTEKELEKINNTFNSNKSKIALIGVNIFPIIVLFVFLCFIPIVFKDDKEVGIIVALIICAGFIHFAKNAIAEVKKAKAKNIYIYDSNVEGKFSSNNTSIKEYFITTNIMQNGSFTRKNIPVTRQEYFNAKMNDEISIVRFEEDYKERNLYILFN